jgi:hypothetical protein
VSRRLLPAAVLPGERLRRGDPGRPGAARRGDWKTEGQRRGQTEAAKGGVEEEVTRRAKLTRVLAAAALTSLLAVAAYGGAAAGAAGKPNVLLILTDDQTSYELDSMPQTAALIRAKGVTFSRYYDSYPLCCPSRATLLSGEYMHNHHVRGNLPAFGGHPRFAALGTEGKALPTWLKAAGYNTAHVGKYLNGYGDDGNPTVPAGWDEWYGQVSDFDPAEVGGKLYYD